MMMREEQKNSLSAVMSKGKMQLIKLAVILVLAFVAFVVIYMMGHSNATKKYEDMVKEMQAEIKELSDQTAQYTVATKEVSLDLINSQIKDIGELATIEYLYTDAGKFEEAKQIFDKDIPFTTKYFITKWDGIIKAGVKVEEITVEIYDTNKEIVVHMPKAEILSHEIDNNSIETLDEKDGLFNSVEVEDVRTFDAISKDAMEERAIENGILDKAYENAKVIIEKIINNDVVQEQGYSVRFEEVVQ